MKRLFALLLALLLLSILASCKEPVSDPTTIPTTVPQTQGPTVSKETDPSTAPSEPEPTIPTEPEPTVPTETEPTEPLETEPTEPPHEHTYEETIVAPTCLEQGYTTYVCSCGDSYTSDYTDAMGHSWGEWETVTEATEETTGLEQRKCLSCDEAETREIPVVVPDHTHSYTSQVTKDASCTEEGELTYTCSCGAFYTESLPMTGHSYASAVTEPTCTEGGYTTHTCQACGDSFSDSFVDPMGHSYTETVTEPTCTTDGYTTQTCSRCDHSYSDNFVPATGHSYTAEVTSEATCTADGIKTYTCSKCCDQYTERIPMLDHDYQSKVTTEPTCTEDGYTTYTCVDCGKSEVKDIVPATGHVNTTEERVEPTCSERGRVITKCNDCGAHVSVQVLPASGDCKYDKKMPLDEAVQAELAKGHHDYASYDLCEDYDVYVCSGCGAIDIESREFRYSEYETASIMLGYVNELRASVGVEPLELNTTLIEKAKITAKTWATTGSRPATGYTGNHVDGGSSIRHHFEKWANGNGKPNMVYDGFKYFGYAIFQSPYEEGKGHYGVMLFQTPG